MHVSCATMIQFNTYFGVALWQASSAELTETNKLKEKLIVNFKALKQKYVETKKELEELRPSLDQSSASDTSLNVSAVTAGVYKYFYWRLAWLMM